MIWMRSERGMLVLVLILLGKDGNQKDSGQHEGKQTPKEQEENGDVPQRKPSYIEDTNI